ncbi:MAG: crotonase/enoyl-CoA hydratase family protein [Chlorobi bacterium]|nr:crotonase/enoyl-CoA hydratase family protein [Chlorobiota bacterium]
MDFIKTEIIDYVLLIELNRNEKMNAFTFQMLQELAEAFTMLEDDKNLRCGFLHSKGDHFTAGLDLADVAKHVAKGATLFGDTVVDPVQLMGRKRTKPVVVTVQGYALTIAIELVLANDICIAAKGTTFGQIEIKRGIFPFGGATIRFAQRCGWGNAMRYLLTGDTFNEDEALRIGLIQEIADNPFETGLAIATTIAKQAPLGVQATIVNATKTFEEGFEAAKADLMPILHRLMQSQDAQEGIQSFVERRAAEFTGE